MTRPARHLPAAAPPTVLPLIDRILFYVLLAVFAVRPLIGEVFERVELSLLEALPQVSGPTPATTAWLDSVLLSASVVALARRGRWRGNPWLAGAIGLLLAAVILSSLYAGDRPRALLAGTSLFIGVLGGAALAALTHARWMRQLVLAALLATGVTTALKCINQQLYEFPDVEDYWKTVQRPELLKQGFDPDDPLFVNYERRLLAREPYGFLAHPNITGSGLMMDGLILCGLAVGLLPLGAGRRAAAIGAVLGVGLCGYALWTTGSLGALLAGGGGLGVLLVLGFAAPGCARHARGVLALLIVGYLGIIGLAAGYGITKGTLPHPSLAFRWHYWTAAARAWPDAPLTGIGRANFAAAYATYKPPESTEDVSDPHSVWVSLLVELGPLGLLAGAALSVIVLRTALRGLAPPPSDEAAFVDRVNAARAAPLAIGVLGLHALFSATPFEAPGMGLVWGIDVAAKWALSFIVGLWLLSRALRSARGRTWLAAGLCAALLAEYVHDLLSFAPLTAGGLAVLVLCAVAARSTESEVIRPVSAGWRGIGVVAAVVLALAHLFLVTWPTTRTERALERLDELLRSPASPGQVETTLKQADALTALGRPSNDPATARAAARAALRSAHNPGLPLETRRTGAQAAVAHAGTMIARNPLDANAYSLRATALECLAALLRQAGDDTAALQAAQEAAESWQHAIERKPADPRTRISAGQAWLEVWRRTGAADAAAHARTHFLAATAIDAVRDPRSSARLRAAERAVIDAALAELNTATSH